MSTPPKSASNDIESPQKQSEDRAGEKTELQTSASPTQSSGPPDGGLTAWLQVVGGFLIFFNTWGIVNTYGEYQTFYETDFLSHESASNISWIGSMQAALLFIVGSATGPLFDAGYMRHLLYAGGFLMSFGMMMTSICKTYWQTFLAQGIVIGLGNGCVFLASVAIIGQYFTKKRAIATGVASVGSSIGGVIYPIVFRRLQPRIGFPWATRVMGFIILVTSIIPILTMKQRVPSSGRRRLIDYSAFTDLPYMLFNIGAFFGFSGIFVVFFYVTLYAVEVCNTDINLSFYLLPIISSASVFGRLLPNFVADRTGPLNIEIIFAFITCLLAFSWIAIKSTSGLIVFCIFYGFFSGPFVSIAGPAIISLTPDLKILGTRTGMSFTFIGIGVLIGSPIAGAVLKSSRGWLGLQIWCGAVLAVSGLFLLAARIAKVGMGLREKA